MKFFTSAKAFPVLCLAMIGIAYMQPSESNTAENDCTKEAWACAAEEHEISMRWGCEDAIKDGLKDPRSYQANNVRYWPSVESSPALVMVKIDYNARNSFGGSVRGNAVCHADANGNIISAKFL